MLDIADSLRRAAVLQQRGVISEAAALYRSIVLHDPSQAHAHHMLGLLALQTGDGRRGLESLDRCLGLDAGNIFARIHRGCALQLLQRHDDAIATFDAALRLEARHAVAWNNRGNSLLELGRFEEAFDSYQHAVRLDPGYASAWSNRANALLQLRRADESLDSTTQALQLQPDLPVALNNRCNALLALGRYEEALEAIERALLAAPQWPMALINRSDVLQKLGRGDEALVSVDLALRLDPRNPQALVCRGSVLRDLHRWSEALADYAEALRLKPDFALAHFNCGNVLLDLNQPLSALSAFDSALVTRTDFAEAHFGRGTSLLRLQRYTEAAQALTRAVTLQPDLPYARGLLLHARLMDADWREFGLLRSDVLEAVAGGQCADEPFSLLAVANEAHTQQLCARGYCAARYPPRPPMWRGPHRPHRRIRLGYISGDLREHPIAYLLAGLFERHDRSRFETFALSLRPPATGAVGARSARAFEHFIDLSCLGDLEAAKRIHEHEIDVVVDLTGLTQGTRLRILAHRPAPVQVSYLGYPGTVAASYMDYLIADEFVVPPPNRHRYDEQVVYLPGCFQINDDRRVIGASITRGDAALPERAFVFCCFNNTFKINPEVFDVWCACLRAVPGSVLWLLGESDTVRSNLRREASGRDIDPQRLIFAGRLPYPEHLARLGLADLALDTWPFNGGATSSDALWAGLPLLTCSGDAYAARMAGSLLISLGLSELVTFEAAAFRQRAIQLALDAGQLAQLRARLRAGLRSAPVFDTTIGCRQIELAFIYMHERALRSEPPAGFTVS